MRMQRDHMKTYRERNPEYWLRGALMMAAVLALVVVLLAMRGWEREQQALARTMSAQGETLIRVIEASRRMGMHAGEARPVRLRNFMQEMIRQGDLLFVAVASLQGEMEAFSEVEPGLGLSGKALMRLPKKAGTAWQVFDDGKRPLFVVYRQGRTPRRVVPARGMMAGNTEPRIIAVGLDATAYLRAADKDIFVLSVSIALVLALTAAGAGAVYWRRRIADLEQEVVRQERLAALGTLAAGVAHEIRNPLSSIKGFATYFGTKFDDGSPDRELAQVMIGEVDRLNRVVSELLELTHPSDLRLQQTDAVEVFRHALRLVEGDCKARGINVSSGFEDIRVVMDADRMLQVLLNLLLNAVQSMPGGGHLDLRLSRSRDWVSFVVEDTGVGIAGDDQDRIFDPYFTTRNKGTGLGLPMVRKIAEAHGGRVRVVSQPGRGTTMTVDLPADRADA